MRRRHQQQPRHERPRKARLREVVDELIPDTERRPEYLQFARELDLSLRRPLKRQAQARGLEMTLQTGNWKLETATMRRRRFPDFSMRTKRIVAKWFRRGLHGRALWRIGEALIGRLFPAGR